MASTLSLSAIHRIILVVNDDRPRYNLKNMLLRPEYELQQVNKEWGAVHMLYTLMKPAPPRNYLDSLEMSLILKGVVNDEDVRAIFEHGKPLAFWGCPRLLVTKMVEVSRRRLKL